MKHCQTRLIFILLFPLIIVICSACNNSDSSKTDESITKNNPRLIGSWQQIAIGGEKVSGVVVKIIFSDHTMTMDAPGCMIIGDYTADSDMLTYTITAVEGERCANTPIGHSDSVHYTVTDSRLTMTPLLAGKENQAIYQKVDSSHQF